MVRYQDILRKQGVFTRIFWVAEPFQLKDGYHLHYLMYSPQAKKFAYRYFYHTWQIATGMWKYDKKRKGWTKGKQIETSDHRWEFRKWNRIQMQSFKTKGGASSYCTKYITKGAITYDLLSNLKPTN